MTHPITKTQLEAIKDHLGKGNVEKWYEDVDLDGKSFKIALQPAECDFYDDGFSFRKITLHPEFIRRNGNVGENVTGDAFIFAEEGETYDYTDPKFTAPVDDFYLNDKRFGGEDLQAENYKKYYLDAYIHGCTIFSIAGRGMNCRWDTSRGVGIAYLEKTKFLEMGFTLEQWNDEDFCENQIKIFLEFINANYNGYTEIHVNTAEDYICYGDYTTDYKEMCKILETEIFEVREVEPYIEKLQSRHLSDEVKYTNLEVLHKYILDTTGTDVKADLEGINFAFDDRCCITFDTLKEHFNDIGHNAHTKYILDALVLNQIKFIEL